MPSSPGYKRDYKAEYKKYHSKPKQKKNRASRNAARAKLKKSGANVSGKDVHHKNGNPKDNSRKNLTTTSKSSNRSFKRTKTARKK